jgi:hypothetical protein
MEIKITSIKLKLGNREIDLSLEEARLLKSRLEELFPPAVVLKEYAPIPTPYPWYWTGPIITYSTTSTTKVPDWFTLTTYTNNATIEVDMNNL